MRFGCGLSGLQLGPGMTMAKAIDEMVETVREVASWGLFRYFNFPHHFLSYPWVFPDPLALSARIAPEAGDMWIVPNILMPLYNPVFVAEHVAILDHICHGRFILCALLGYRPLELEVAGITRGERVSRMEEAIPLMKRLWMGEEVTFHGKHFHITGGRLGVTPLQKPHPPVWMAGQSHRAAARAGRIAESCRIGPWVGWKDFVAFGETYRKSFKEAGRQGSPILSASRIVVLGKDPKSAIEQHRKEIENHHTMYNEWQMQEKTMAALRLSVEEAGDCVIAGSHKDCVERLKQFQEAGLTDVFPQFVGMPCDRSARLDYLRGFADEVVQKLRD